MKVMAFLTPLLPFAIAKPLSVAILLATAWTDCLLVRQVDARSGKRTITVTITVGFEACEVERQGQPLQTWPNHL